MKNLFKNYLEKSKLHNYSGLKGDLFWNYGSLIFLAISGLGLNYFISQYYGSSTLGVFNQVLSVYIVLSVFGSGGINYSLVRAISEHQKNNKIINSIIKGSLIPGIILSFFVTLIFGVSIKYLERLLGSEDVGIGLKLIIPGVFFFSINKILLLGILNGLRRMKSFAFYQSLRYILILTGLFIGLIIKIKGECITFIFSFAESILFIILITDISTKIKWWLGENYLYWTKIHLSFGIKCFWSGVFTELNSKIDIIMLGVFLSDEKVGIYSFAAFCIEGIYQIFVVLQNNFNPIIASYLSSKDKKNLGLFIQKSKKSTYTIMIVITLLSIIIYPLLIYYLNINKSLSASILPFTILSIGILISSGYIPFNNIFAMANLPSWHSIFMLMNIATNIFLNYCLIPYYGIIGASIASSISFIISALLLKLGTKILLSLKI